MRRRGIYLLAGLILLAVIATAVYYVVITGKSTHKLIVQEQGSTSKYNSGNILIIVYPYFRWEEYHAVYTALRDAGYRPYVLCMTNSTTIAGVDEENHIHRVICDLHIPLTEIDYDRYIAAVFIGGPGLYCILDYEAHDLGLVSLDNWCIKLLGGYLRSSKRLLAYGVEIAKSMYERGRIVAAICVAPVILCMAHVIDGREFTMFRCTVTNRLVVHYGCTRLVNKPVVVSGRLVTGSGPQAAEAFAETLVKVLKGEK